jgi:hypothetical protein
MSAAGPAGAGPVPGANLIMLPDSSPDDETEDEDEDEHHG